MIYDLDIKFLFYDGGLGGDALARAITCRLPLSNNYDTSYCDKSLNKHSCNDVFSGLFQKKLISKELAEKLNLSSASISGLPINEKKILLEFCFKLWLVSWENSEYDDYNYNGTEWQCIESFKLVVGQELNNVTRQLVDYLKTCKIPSNLPKGPYLAKGHYLRWESELATFFSKYENIYLTISKDDNQINFKDKLWAFNVLWYIKTGKTEWNELGYISQDRAFNYFPEALTCLKPELWYQPTYTFDAYKLVVLEQTSLSTELLKIFNLNLNGVVHDFLRNNAKLNQEMVKEFKYDQNFQV
tara:strand:- start:3556 stop:4455 length:900 start_codon:yes stop_codon:yes gene_type:complete